MMVFNRNRSRVFTLKCGPRAICRRLQDRLVENADSEVDGGDQITYLSLHVSQKSHLLGTCMKFFLR